MKSITYAIFIWLAFYPAAVVFAMDSSAQENQAGKENYYERYFKKPKKTIYNDTMFFRTLWHKKVSYLVLESLKEGYYVTLLVIPESPYNYKAQTYPLHYFFNSYEQAFKKMIWLDGFLKKGGILKVEILGSLIKNEKILKNPAALNQNPL